MTEEYHTVTVDLQAIPTKANKVLIDGVEVRHVTDFVLAAGYSEATKVTISFFANVRGTFGGVAIKDAIEGGRSMPQTMNFPVSVKDLPEVQFRLQQLNDAREKYLKLYAALACHEPRIDLSVGRLALDMYLCITKDYDAPAGD